MTFTNISRRTLLGSSAAGIAAATLSGTNVLADDVMPKTGCGHGAKHAKFSKTLGGFATDPFVSEAQKNMALRTASCPDCGVHLAASH